MYFYGKGQTLISKYLLTCTVATTAGYQSFQKEFSLLLFSSVILPLIEAKNQDAVLLGLEISILISPSLYRNGLFVRQERYD